MVNRLSESKSLYLRKHAENPIDWWPWCDEALETARLANKPIFLSIGYSSCHWCTVMEGEAFSDPGIAQYMNQHFLPIKVDREERPEIDSIYMQALQMMTGQGGWPLNIFLTPDERIPFYGGTYFPLEPRYGRPGFLEVLQAIRRFYDLEKTKLQAFKDEIMTHLQQATILPISELTEDLLQKGLEANTGVVSRNEYGGPRFPMIPYTDMALRRIRFNIQDQYDAKQACTQRGLDLALGGIYDHVAGGFHRYTVDPTWTVPHFEKMLYDNGQIVEYLANLWSAGIQKPAFKRSIQGTVAWLKREMTAPEGYFYASQDADNFTAPDESEPEEGAFYVWHNSELEKVLNPEEYAVLQEQFTITKAGNFEGKNVLQRTNADEFNHIIESALAKLFKVRYGELPETVKTFAPARNNQEAKTYPGLGRIPPVTDTKMIVAWNGLMISGLATAARVLGDVEYLELATKATQFILKNQWIDGRLHRVNYEGQPDVVAQSEDYALLIKALIDLHQASLTVTTDSVQSDYWLEQAKKVQEEFNNLLWSVELGGYFNTAKDTGEDLLIRERSYIDNATTAANGVAISNLVRLFLLTENLELLDLAEQGLTAFSSVMQKSPQACPSLFTALDWYRNNTLVRTSPQQISALSVQYFPAIIFKADHTLPNDIIGLVCQGLKCNKPAQSSEEMLQQLQASQSRS
ncbi:thioredoxin domain-containing protein [Planktothrix mougeotii]|uniref:Thioredoxin domain-containing protein n=1 Tax=Planktothrix mougeotii LEGE 06226 TaxID=1828728 RepID=A0ABR9UEU5_9CYAN|nr:thioredoxin domain-containing protein [Planktothrix mougeotii]MBE9144958.1 thioredoxin domain-containing protein [Planktothrix mougeotii LEGE 06226]